MAESACLRRSFSNPSEPSHEFSDGDPIRALGESISFGRYMSETLAWEKWSAFSHNRYREEAEKYSKPGSVAKMKAYFEAHYKKVGVKKPIALEQANNGSSFVQLEVEDTHNVDHLVSSSSSTSSSPALNLKPAFPNNEIRRSLSSPALHPGIDVPNSNLNDDELTRKDSPNLEAHSSVNISCDDSSAQAKESENEAAINAESSLVQVYQGDDAVVNDSITEISAEIKIVQPKDAIESGKIQITPKREATIEKEATDKLDLKSNKKSADAPLRSSKNSNVSKLSSSLARLSTPVQPKKEGDGNLRNPKSTRVSLEKKKSMPKLVQKSADVNADVKLMKKSSPASHKSGIGKAFTPLGKIVSQSFARTPALSATRASVNSVSRHTFATPQSETKRSRVALEKSFAKNRTDQKLQSPAVGNMKSPAQSLITFSPFSFRTEERAKKRKEFFERRLEKEAEKLQLQEKNKVKSKAEFRKSSQCANFSNTALNSRREILSEKTKIPIAPPQPPKYDNSKPSTNMARGKCFQPHRSSVSSKPVSGNKSAPVTLPTKKRHENDSPNIL